MIGLSMDDVVALNALIVTAIGLSFAIGMTNRRDRGRLNLSGPKRQSIREPYGAAALKRLEDQEANELETVSPVRQLNVFFNWNGHTWDAYEVLGLPAGAARHAVIEAFHAQRARSSDSTPFLQAAADAILKR